MVIIDSNDTCLDCFEPAKFEERSELYKARTLFHHSSVEAIENIASSRTIWLPVFEYQETESCFAPAKKGTFFMASFSLDLWDLATIKKNKFGDSKETSYASLTVKGDGLESFVDKDVCPVLIAGGKDFNVGCVGHSSMPNEGASNEFLGRIWARFHFAKVRYVSNDENICNLVLENEGRQVVICNLVGRNIKDDFSWQNEVKLVAELMATSPVQIPDPERLELRFGKSVSLETNVIE